MSNIAHKGHCQTFLIFFWAIAVAIAVYAAPTPLLVPLPNKCEDRDEAFSFKAGAKICYDSDLRDEALMLADALHAPQVSNQSSS